MDEALGRTSATKQRTRGVRSMTREEIATEWRRLSGLRDTRVGDREVSAADQFERIFLSQDKPQPRGEDLSMVVSSFIAGNTHGAIARHPRVWDTITRTPLERPTTLYRGIGALRPEDINLSVGDQINVNRAASFSDTRRVAEGFAARGDPGGGILLRVRRATRGADVRRISQIPTEREVILGGRYRISRISTEGGRTVYDLEEV